MKRLQIILLTTSVALFLALAGCGRSNGEPEPVPPPPEMVDVPLWSWIWNGNAKRCFDKLECLNLKLQAGGPAEEDYDPMNVPCTWRLLADYKIDSLKQPIFNDYSCSSVLYVFEADTMVRLLSDTAAIPSDTLFYGGGTLIEYGYDGPISEIRFLMIGREMFYCQVANQIMIISSAKEIGNEVAKAKQGDVGRILLKVND